MSPDDCLDCTGWSRDVTEGEQTSLRWWDLSVFKYRSGQSLSQLEYYDTDTNLAGLISLLILEMILELFLSRLAAHLLGLSPQTSLGFNVY